MFVLLFISCAAAAEQVTLNGDLGCISQSSHNERLALLQKSLGTNDEHLKSEYSKQIVQISKSDCAQLTGEFTVLRSTKDFYQVKNHGQKLWLIR